METVSTTTTTTIKSYYHDQPFGRVHFSTNEEPIGIPHPISTSIEFAIESTTITEAAIESLQLPSFEEGCLYAPSPHLAHRFAVDDMLLAAAKNPSLQKLRLVQVKFSSGTLAVVLQHTRMVLVEDCWLSDGCVQLNLETTTHDDDDVPSMLF
jgi:hypothetical protein